MVLKEEKTVRIILHKVFLLNIKESKENIEKKKREGERKVQDLASRALESNTKLG